MRVWVYSNAAHTRATAVCIDENAVDIRVLRIATNIIIDTDWRLGEFMRDCMAGLPSYPAPKEYYETAGGGLTSAVGYLWEIDSTMEKVATFWCRGVK